MQPDEWPTEEAPLTRKFSLRSPFGMFGWLTVSFGKTPNSKRIRTGGYSELSLVKCRVQ
jgi:hypothetical protein